MSEIVSRIKLIESQLEEKVKLITVSKKQPLSKIKEAYQSGFRRFGENYVQELVDKHAELPEGIEWHMIGHLQRNKVKYIAPFVSLVHSVDSLRLLKEINKQAKKNDRIINCLLQIHIAQEDSKSGLNENQLFELLKENLEDLNNIRIIGLMGMSTFTDDMAVVKTEFDGLAIIFEKVKNEFPNLPISELSMGMSGDWKLAVASGSTMIRVGSSIFGERQ